MRLLQSFAVATVPSKLSSGLSTAVRQENPLLGRVAAFFPHDATSVFKALANLHSNVAAAVVSAPRQKIKGSKGPVTCKFICGSQDRLWQTSAKTTPIWIRDEAQRGFLLRTRILATRVNDGAKIGVFLWATRQFSEN